MVTPDIAFRAEQDLAHHQRLQTLNAAFGQGRLLRPSYADQAVILTQASILGIRRDIAGIVADREARVGDAVIGGRVFGMLRFDGCQRRPLRAWPG